MPSIRDSGASAGPTEVDVRFRSNSMALDRNSLSAAATVRKRGAIAETTLTVKPGTFPSANATVLSLTYLWDISGLDDNTAYELLIGGQADTANPPNVAQKIVADTFTLSTAQQSSSDTTPPTWSDS